MEKQRCIKPITLGIAGGIGSGKSYTTAELVAQGAVKFDADVEARNLYNDPNVLAAIKERWPQVVNTDGSVNRGKIAEIVFSDDDAGRRELLFLNSVIHPILIDKFREWKESVQEFEFLVLDAPLLFETGLESQVDYVIFVDADEETRRRRSLARGWADDELARRELRQIPLDYKKARADFVVDASRDDSSMDRQVSEILKRIRARRSSDQRSDF